MAVVDDSVVVALCRHGLTEANVRRAYLGWTDSPLMAEPTPLNDAFDSFYTSDLGRCLATIKGLFPKCSPIQLSELREMHFGVFEGKTHEQLKDDRTYQQWLEAYENVATPEGESFQQFAARVNRGYQKLIRDMLINKHQCAFVVSHAGVIRQLLTSYAPAKRDYWDWHITHDEYYELTFTTKGLKMGARAISLNQLKTH